MAKQIINSSLALLLSLTIIVSLFSLTILNDNFIKKELQKNDYYDEVYNELKIEMSNTNLTKDIVIKDINNFIKSDYNKQKKYSISDNSEIYNYYIKFKNFFDNFNFYKFKIVIYIVNLVLIFLCGNIFIKTKKYHHINNVLLYSAIINILFYGLSYLFININNHILLNIYHTYLHIILGTSIILIECSIYKLIKHKRQLL